MITNEDIDRAFLTENMKLNQAINVAQFDFYKPELKRSMMLTRQMMERQQKTGDNPLAVEGGTNGVQGRVH